MKKISSILSLTIFSLMISAADALAQEQQQDADPGVARISLMNGEVSTQRGDSGDWIAATVNAPLVNGDRVATAANSRAEIQLDYANILRLNEKSEVQVAELANNRIQVQVASGLVNYVVFKGAQANSEIDTPNVVVRPMGEGVYRIEVEGAGQTLVTVRKGQAQVSTPQGSTTVRQGERITARGSADDVQYRTDLAVGKDEWDSFNDQRDSAILNAESYRYTNQYYTGVSDLDQHGRWVHVPGYDWCWTPNVDSGWTPYSDGRWTWQPYYGWTWVPYESWGWAPYHYGRWFSYNNAWAWWPGPVWGVGIGYRPIWAPAYVSFFGFGYGHRNFGFGFGFGFGSIGWLPIGPCDPFIPWYGRGGWGRGGYYNHYNAVNITNVTNVHNVTNIRNITGIQNAMGPLSTRANGYSNLQGIQRGDAHVARAFNMVSSDRFGQGSLRGAIQHPGSASLKEGRLVAGGLPVVPTRASLSPSSSAASSAAIPRNSGRQQTFAGQQSNSRPQGFSQSASQVQQMVQRQNSQTAMNEHRAGVGANETSRNGNTSFQGSGSPAAGALGRSPAGSINSGRTFEKAPAANGKNGIVEQRQAGQPQQAWQRFGSQSAARTEQQGARAASDRAGYVQQAPSRIGSTSPQNGGGNGGWRRFSGSSTGTAGAPQGQAGAQGSGRSFYSPRTTPQSGSQTPSRPQSNWQPFQSRPAPQTWVGNSSGQPGNSGWGRFSGGSGRSALDLNKPIVTPRNPSYGGGYSRGYSTPPGNYGDGGYSRGYSTPPGNYGDGGYSRGYSTPPGNYGGGGYSGPRSTYGGGYSAPRGNFGGYSSTPRSGSGGSGGRQGGGGGYSSGGGRGGGSSGHSGGGSNSRR